MQLAGQANSVVDFDALRGDLASQRARRTLIELKVIVLVRELHDDGKDPGHHRSERQKHDQELA